MKKLHHLFLCIGVAAFCLSATHAYADTKIGVVNFKTCLEKSNLGKQEQGSFEGMKKQMESILEEKGKVLDALEVKTQDSDYMDSLSPEAEAEFHRKGRAMKQELMQLQNQYLQTLNQANFKIVQKLTEAIAKASKEIAAERKLDLVINEEGSFYYNPQLDISEVVSARMDAIMKQESKDNQAAFN